ncbi:hypothetical protein Tsubulata_011714 [Turnera subulata]|uniref:Small-subunit processome Utp12 domain-containing protein n=1 Tax=Turnera subulata TaxID=218843 RepID=A0A9Q0JLE3_9ROSI|nr:hypothetical protein Tsubulata_011714 [Turnera subulata]
MVSTDIRDILTSFSPSLDYLAISSGDGRVKIWDAVKGQLQTEFADITSGDASLFSKPERGHLSIDYKCIKWLSLERKKKRKLGSSLLVLGTGSGDVMALDVSAGQLKWTVSDCHPGGVSAISFSTHDSCIYTGGADGMVCKIDPQTGNMMEKFRASRKSISCISVSSDGEILATAAAQMKTFSCTDHKKNQKFSGHPGSVRCMIFSEDGKYILSSAVGERYVAIWRADGGKKQSASCVLAMEHPAVFLDSKPFKNQGDNEAGLYVLAISETGVCYTWHGQSIEELRSCKPAKVWLSHESSLSKNHKGPSPAIFAAKLQGITKSAAAQVFAAYGSIVKPIFQKILVDSGVNLKLEYSRDGVLLPPSHSLIKDKKGMNVQHQVTALDRSNVEDALLPMAKVPDFLEKKLGIKNIGINRDEAMTESMEKRDDLVKVDNVVEKHLRRLNILGDKDNSTFNSITSKGIILEAYYPQKKIKAAVLSMEPSKAYELLEDLVGVWQSRSCTGKNVLPWIYSILVNHNSYIMAQEKTDMQMLNSLLKITKSRMVAVQPLLQLSGRLQLVTAQINRAATNKTHTALHNDEMNDNEEDDQEDDDDVEDQLYREEDDESQLSSDDDN